MISRDVLKQIVRNCIGSSNALVRFQNEPDSFYGHSGLDKNGGVLAYPYFESGGLSVVLNVSSLQLLHTDERRFEFQIGAQEQEERMGGHRKFTLNIRIESDQSGQSYELADRIQTRWKRRGNMQLLHDAKMSLVRFGACTSFDLEWDNRFISACNLQVELMVFVDDSFDPTNDKNWIETAEVEKV
jgi:hypothetical protein